MNLADYRAKYNRDDAAPGWDAIDAALKKLYPDQEPRHYGTPIKYMIGGPDPIDGLSIYQAQDADGAHLHIVTYGFSELYYAEEALGEEFSKFGFELTMRLRPHGEDDNPPMWAMNMLQNVAKYVFKSGNWLEDGHYMTAKGPIKSGADTKLFGLAFTEDPELGAIQTVHGEVQFLQVFGVTQNELDQMVDVDKNAQRVLAAHKEKNPMLVTDLTRDEL